MYRLLGVWGPPPKDVYRLPGVWGPTPKDVYRVLGVWEPTPKDVYKVLGVWGPTPKNVDGLRRAPPPSSDLRVNLNQPLPWLIMVWRYVA